MGLIRTSGSNVDGRGVVPFSMKDVEEEAREILANARAEAGELKEAAAGEAAQQGRREGYARGLEEGRAAGREEALEEHRAQLSATAAALAAAATELDASRRDLENAIVREVTELAVAIARRVTKRAGLLDPEVLAGNLDEVIKQVVGASDVRIALHPDQKRMLEEILPRLRLRWPPLMHVAIVEDGGVTPGGCRLHTAEGMVDADLEGQIERIVAEMMPAREGDAGVAPATDAYRGRRRRVKYLGGQLEAVQAAMPLRVVGKVRGLSGLTIEAGELALPVGALCRISSAQSKTSVAEVVGFAGEKTLLMALSDTGGISRGDSIENLECSPRVRCSERLLGRVLDGLGRPIDGKGALPMEEARRVDGRGVAPMERQNIRESFATGVRAIDGLHTCGLGQRVGIFSGPGVGKSTLLSSIARHSSADVSVVALIGERGREVQEFLEKSLGAEGLARCVVIVSTADEAPLLCVRAAKLAATVAEYFRDCGKNVLLLMDSLTRLCHAQRQIGLAAREPPATRGFPPSVFALLPEILERAGKTARGSITGFYNVLIEGDDFNEPIADAVRGITDGHLSLSRTLAARGHFPAIDVLHSVSRVREDVVEGAHLAAARRVLGLLGVYEEIEELVNVGAYVAGVNPEFDLAVKARPRVLAYLRQASGICCSMQQSRTELIELARWIETQMVPAVREKQSAGVRTSGGLKPILRKA